MNKKKKKAPAAQNLIDSLLDDRTPVQSENTGEPVELNLGSIDVHGDAEIQTIYSGFMPSSVAKTGDADADEPTPSITEDRFEFPDVSGDTAPKFLVDLDKVAEKSAHLSLDDEPGELILDPVAKAEKTAMVERTRLMALQNEKQQAKSQPMTPAAAQSQSDFGAIDEDLTEKTVRLSPPAPTPNASAEKTASVTELRPKSRPYEPPIQRPTQAPSSAVYSSTEAALKQSESLRIAQMRISDLENELERLRRENEKLTSAGETLRRRGDELMTKTENAEAQAREIQKIFEEEKRVLRGQLTQKERENAELRSQNEEMEGRLEANFKKIRVRERELEHRLEIIKMESATLVATKDKMILELKRQIDQLMHETEYGKQKSQELFSQYKEKQETIRRVVRALRIALTILEGDEDSVAPLKKAE